jgi:hypothetical protein
VGGGWSTLPVSVRADSGPSGPDLGLQAGLVLAACSTWCEPRAGLHLCGKEEDGESAAHSRAGKREVGAQRGGLCGVALEVCLRPPSSPLSRMVLWLVACFCWCSCVSLVWDQREGWEKSLQMQDHGDACGCRYLLGGVIEALLVLPSFELQGKP